MSPDDYIRSTEGYIAENVAEVYDLYQKRLYENNAMDFDDLIMQTVALLELFPEVPRTLPEPFQIHPRGRVPGTPTTPSTSSSISWPPHIVTCVASATTINVSCGVRW